MPEDERSRRMIAGTIPIPENRERLISNTAWFVALLAYLPGSFVLQWLVETYQVGSVLGWPVLHLWIIFVGPAIFFLVYLYDTYHRIGLDVRFEEAETLEQGGDD